ncbi:MAG: wax ester/triacylglycerol synthase family O-acyltransferase [Halioglobus sp.]|nr:wax ester/triacylglycerol synthase family O-acyltransferase [Halioglobus sp.]
MTDASFLLAEKRETPMHVGGINLFTLPEGADEHRFLSGLADVLRNAEEFRKPFGEFVKVSPLGLFWEKDEHIDLDYHVRHSALPKPGRYRELFALASRLHSVLLDRNRPLWETHLIEGLQNRQFALYQKVHHAAIDGVGAMQLTRSAYSTRKTERLHHSPFSTQAYERLKTLKYGNTPRSVTRPSRAEMHNVMDALKQTYDSGIHLATAMGRFSGAFFGRGGNLAVPWHNVPRTSINTRVSGARRFVAQSWEFERVKAVCRAVDGTLNDIVLAMCSGALRRYLLSRNELPSHSLKAMAPISLREEGDLESANAVAFITADLATNTRDPERRLRQIQDSMRAGKALLADMSAREAAIFMQLTQVPAIVSSVLGLAARYPAYSTVISNVPGPREQLYWNGARLDGIYPASIVFDGFAMNITLVSYHESLDFGIVACRRSLPQIQRIIDHLEESLQELEALVGLPVGGAGNKAAGRRKAAAGKSGKRKTPAKKAAAKTSKNRKKAVAKAATAKKPAKKRSAKKAVARKRKAP